MDGLAYRIKMLTKNTSLSSLLLSSNNDVNVNVSNDVDDTLRTLPTSALDIIKEHGDGDDNDNDNETDYVYDDTFSFPNQNVAFVAAGYNHRELQKQTKTEQRKTLNALIKLAKAIKGGTPPATALTDENTSKIPFISIPHGLISDGGYALNMGSYVLATSDSRFRIMNPLRGLALDPVGLSYILPRLGWEYQQPSASYPVGSILALTGYEANESDMVETGLATHFLDSIGKLGAVERALANLAPYEQQKLIKEPSTRYGDVSAENSNRDMNARFRNAAVAGLMHAVSAYDAMGQEIVSARDEAAFLADEDPSLVLEADRGQMFGDRESMLLNVAATFQDVFEEEKSVEGIVERMREYASAETSNEEEVEFVNAAKELLAGMEAQSPLALRAVHKLMTIGKEAKETLETCMERERKVQLRLFEKDDFNNWAKSGAKEGEFKDWKHASVKDVTSGEVEELFK